MISCSLVCWLIVGLLSLAHGMSLADSPPLQAISKLESVIFDKREEGQSELLMWGKQFPVAAKTELLNQMRTSQSPEVRVRCTEVLKELVVDEYLKEGSGYMGIGFTGETVKVPADPKLRSVIRINHIQPNTPASHAGVLVGDCVVGLDADVWYDDRAQAAFQEKIKAKKPNTEVSLRILRDGKILVKSVTLIRRPIALDGLLPLNRRKIDFEGPERAAKEAYFRNWLETKNSQR